MSKLTKMTKLPPAPRELSTDAKKLWREILKDYPGLAGDRAHLEVLRVALLAHDRAESCRTKIDRLGEILFDRFKQPKPNPLLAAERDARAAFLGAIKQLGLDPGIGG